MYDPEVAPEPAAWLALDESERVALVADALSADGTPVAPVRAAVQAVIETQVATGEPAAAAGAVTRLTEEGLRRSIVMRVLTVLLMKHMQRGMQAGAFDNDAYSTELDGLTGAAILAEALGISLRTAERRWRSAKALLNHLLAP